ncbi:MAG: ComEA family DNA-binding protein [Betaproteobacteria bacterium]
MGGIVRTLLAALVVILVSFIAPAFAMELQPVLVAQAKSEPIDINRAKADDLMTLKGIGEARAAAIIKGRPYARKDELVQRKVLPEAVYNEIKEKIVAKQ